ALHHLSPSPAAATTATASPATKSPAAARRASTLEATAASAELLGTTGLPALHPALSVSRRAIALADAAECAWICSLAAEAARLLTWQVPGTRPLPAALTRLAGRQLAGCGSGPLDLAAAGALNLTPARTLTLTGTRPLTLTPAGPLNLAAAGAASGAEIGAVRQIAGS